MRLLRVPNLRHRIRTACILLSAAICGLFVVLWIWSIFAAVNLWWQFPISGNARQWLCRSDVVITNGAVHIQQQFIDVADSEPIPSELSWRIFWTHTLYPMMALKNLYSFELSTLYPGTWTGWVNNTLLHFPLWLLILPTALPWLLHRRRSRRNRKGFEVSTPPASAPTPEPARV